ncbi:uncharacterized protein BDW70DRAFT_164552 [Aspergillus foveolatus]|uniref:uncharacterized protein n=1 Tax=Aspergillus foveolatus TaxID=210207 RepID=UPI003CCD9EAC
MIPEALQPRALLAPPRTLASHFRTLIAADASIENLTFIDRCILDQIHTEAIPSSVYEVWLSLTCRYSQQFTVAALTNPSCGVRFVARHFARRLFLSTHWKERGWDFLGGAQGIKGILDSLPLMEARLLLKLIFGRCQVVPDRKVVSVCIEEFLDLVEATDPWLSRTLLSHVSHLYAYCSAERVEDMLRSQSPKCPELLEYTSRVHTPLLRRIAIGRVEMPKEVRRKTLQQCQTALLRSKEPYDPIYYQDVQLTLTLTPGLLFGMDLLTALEKEPEMLKSHALERLVEAMARQGIRDKLPFGSLLRILSQGFAVLQARAMRLLSTTSGWLSRALSRDIVQFWSISRFGGVKGSHEGLVGQYQKRRRLKDLSAYQVELEDCLIMRVLQVQDESFQNQGEKHGQSSETLNSLLCLVNIRGRKEFLQLVCRHSPTLGFDLTAWPPSQREQELMPCWDLDVLDRLRPDDSESLFGRSLHIYHCEEFLPSFDSRNPELKMPSWEAQCLLWASWESATPKRKGFPITLKVLGEMKQKSMRAREPAERLRWATSAVKLAARTSSIDIFAEIVEWTSRYIRDPASPFTNPAKSYLVILDTLKAEPNAPTYSALLFGTFDLIEILLSSDKPQLAVDIMIRVWKDFPGESSFHRKISLVKLGRVLFPEQGRELMSRFAGYVCDALQAQQDQNQQQPKEKKGFIKVTTAKMLAQALAEADFLSQADRMEILQKMFSSARHVDIRREIVAALLNLVGSCENPEPYKVFASIVSSVTGPNERAVTTEVEWEMAENPERGGPLPYVAPLTERPVLNSAFSAAFWSIPEKLRPEYVENRTRLDPSFQISQIRFFWRWTEYLPESFLRQFHRPWALSYLHYESFARIDSALAVTAEAPLKDSNVRDHWEIFFASLCGRPAIYSLEKLLSQFVKGGSKALNGLNTALILEEFEFCAELIIRNPVKYNRSVKKYILHPEYTLEPFRALRDSRIQSVSDVKEPADKAQIYHDLTDAMARVISVCETVRREGWSATDYPVTLPSQFEYHALLLPSPIYNPSASESHSAAEIFISALVDLIIKNSADSTLLLKLDSFQSVLREIPSADLKACMLRLGCVWRELEKQNPIIICVGVKLARSLLDNMRSDEAFLKRDVDILGMIEEWKKNDVEFVRQTGWEVEL